MKSIKYTPDAADKLRRLNHYISKEYGKAKAKKIVRSITEDFMRQLFGINTTSQETIDYWGE